MIGNLNVLLQALLFLQLGVCAAVAQQGYREHRIPAQLTFSEPTNAFDPADPSNRLGQFQPGIRVAVEGVDPENPSFWRVRFEAPGSAPLAALIAIPSSSELGGRGWLEVQSVLSGFPLLQRLLEHPDPWSSDLRENPGSLLSGQIVSPEGSGRLLCRQPGSNRVWGSAPLHLAYDRANPERPKYIVELWNKGEAYRRPDFRGEPERNALRRQLEQITAFFDPSGNSVRRERGSNPHIRGLRDNIEFYTLPNDLRVALHFHHGEYLFLEIEQASVAEQARTISRSPAELAEYLRTKVGERDNGLRYIRGIPMIDQGQTAYCVPATMARLLNFYGYDVHTHSLAMLAETHEQRYATGGGTTQESLMTAMRRITDGSPFRLREIESTRPESIRRAVASGLPIVWLIPGHMRLIIGISDDGRSIVYSDSWGPGHDFKTMSFHEFGQMNRGMWVLEPR